MRKIPKVRKTFKAVIILSAVLLTGIFIYKEFQGRKNLLNFEKIKIGMSKDEVIELMGYPKFRDIARSVEGDSMYFYQPPFASASGLEIEFDHKGKVLNRFGFD